MSESLDIDSPLRGWAMPRSYSGDLRERLIEVVEMLYKAIREKQLKARKYGTRTIITRIALQAFLDSLPPSSR